MRGLNHYVAPARHRRNLVLAVWPNSLDLRTLISNPLWLRRQIGAVLQENVLFNQSIRDNIALPDPVMPIERVAEAAKLAGAHDFILELPEWNRAISQPEQSGQAAWHRAQDA